MAAITYPSTLACLLLALIPGSCALYCYQCTYGSGDETDCRNAGVLLNMTDTGRTFPFLNFTVSGNKYYKICSENQTKCMIETFESGGSYKFYHRDCSDGKKFSFLMTGYPRLGNRPADNTTACSYNSAANMEVCIRLCDKNLCNGPQPQANTETGCILRNVTNAFGQTYQTCGATGFMAEVAGREAILIMAVFYIIARVLVQGWT